MQLKLANSREELEQILILQNENHFDHLSKQLRKVDGFVTVRHDIEMLIEMNSLAKQVIACLLYTSPSPRDGLLSRMPSSA